MKKFSLHSILFNHSNNGSRTSFSPLPSPLQSPSSSNFHTLDNTITTQNTPRNTPQNTNNLLQQDQIQDPDPDQDLFKPLPKHDHSISAHLSVNKSYNRLRQKLSNLTSSSDNNNNNQLSTQEEQPPPSPLLFKPNSHPTPPFPPSSSSQNETGFPLLPDPHQTDSTASIHKNLISVSDDFEGLNISLSTASTICSDESFLDVVSPASNSPSRSLSMSLRRGLNTDSSPSENQTEGTFTFAPQPAAMKYAQAVNFMSTQQHQRHLQLQQQNQQQQQQDLQQQQQITEYADIMDVVLNLVDFSDQDPETTVNKQIRNNDTMRISNETPQLLTAPVSPADGLARCQMKHNAMLLEHEQRVQYTQELKTQIMMLEEELLILSDEEAHESEDDGWTRNASKSNLRKIGNENGSRGGPNISSSRYGNRTHSSNSKAIDANIKQLEVLLQEETWKVGALAEEIHELEMAGIF